MNIKLIPETATEAYATALTVGEKIIIGDGEGFLPRVKTNEKPSLADGEFLVYHYTKCADRIEQEYLLFTDPNDIRLTYPRTFSKLQCVGALIKAGVWEDCKEWITKAGLYDLYLAAQNFREDNEWFVLGKAELAAKLGWTDEQIEAVLKKCIVTE